MVLDMLTDDQVRRIRAEKTHTVIPTPYMFEFEEEWNEVVELLKKSKADLSKIKLVVKEGN